MSFPFLFEGRKRRRRGALYWAIVPALSLFAVSLAADSPVLWTSWGDGQSEGLGTSVAIGGDFDHDGHPDVIAGAPPASVLILSGVDGALLRAFAGPGDSQAFGHAVSDAGDLDADGTPDVLVGDPEAGRVFALSGADGAELLRLQGPRGYGTSVAGVGDMTGDSVPDFVVGSPEESLAVLLSGVSGWPLLGFTGNGYNVGWSVAGAGDLTGDGSREFLIGAPTGRRGYAILASYPGGPIRHFQVGRKPVLFFGYSVAAVGDLDRDGVGDYAVGAPTNEKSHPSGSVLVYSGRNGHKLAKVRGEPGIYMGTAVAPAGDYNGDGIPDVAIGQATGYDFSRVEVRLGPNLKHWVLRVEAPADFGMATAVAGGTDINGDGRPDLVLGMKRYVAVFTQPPAP